MNPDDRTRAHLSTLRLIRPILHAVVACGTTCEHVLAELVAAGQVTPERLEEACARARARHERDGFAPPWLPEQAQLLAQLDDVERTLLTNLTWPAPVVPDDLADLDDDR